MRSLPCCPDECCHGVSKNDFAMLSRRIARRMLPSCLEDVSNVFSHNFASTMCFLTVHVVWKKVWTEMRSLPCCLEQVYHVVSENFTNQGLPTIWLSK